jgi:gas vesicle protein
MKTQIEKLISISRNVADMHENYSIIGEIVRHTPNVRIHQMNTDKEKEFTSVYLNSGEVEFKVNFSSYRGVTLEFHYATNIEEVLDSLISAVLESLSAWHETYQEDMARIKEEILEKRKQLLIKLTNEINEMEGKK